MTICVYHLFILLTQWHGNGNMTIPKVFFFLLKAARGVDFFWWCIKNQRCGRHKLRNYLISVLCCLAGSLTDISYCDPLCQTLKLRFLSNRQWRVTLAASHVLNTHLCTILFELILSMFKGPVQSGFSPQKWATGNRNQFLTKLGPNWTGLNRFFQS